MRSTCGSSGNRNIGVSVCVLPNYLCFWGLAYVSVRERPPPLLGYLSFASLENSSISSILLAVPEGRQCDYSKDFVPKTSSWLQLIEGRRKIKSDSLSANLPQSDFVPWSKVTSPLKVAWSTLPSSRSHSLCWSLWALGWQQPVWS